MLRGKWFEALPWFNSLKSWWDWLVYCPKIGLFKVLMHCSYDMINMLYDFSIYEITLIFIDEFDDLSWHLNLYYAYEP